MITQYTIEVLDKGFLVTTFESTDQQEDKITKCACGTIYDLYTHTENIREKIKQQKSED